MSAAEPHAKRAEDYRRSASPKPGAARPVLSIEGIVAAMRHPLMVAFLSLAALIQVYRTAAALPGRIHEEDFADYYAAATIMRQGENPYHTSLAPVGAKLGLHTKSFKYDEIIPETPAFLLCLKALGALPLTQAYWTWIAINFAALIASFYLLLGPGSGLRPVDACLMVALALMYPPLIDLFLTAQSQVLVILGLALSVRWLARGRDGVAGLMLAALTLVRGYPVLMGLYLMLTRKWRAFVFMAAGGAIGLVACAAMMGWRAVVDFPLGLAAAGGDRALFKLGWNTAPASFVWRLCLYLNGWHLGPAGDRFAHALGYAASLALMAFTLKATFKRGAEPDRDWSLFALWIVTSIEVLPVSWLLQYLVVRSVRAGRLGGGAQPGQ
ncbi:MAG TPA: glycosyltransferase family 87 protein [Candidatus Binataceae bacterium]|nr:glycosyltransferase family 87 protein [Candidatus Binataceae bacterium]